MSYHFYLVLHLLAVFMIIASLSGIAVHLIGGGSRDNFKARKLMGAVHGIGLLIAIVAGFGLLARLGVAHGGLPGWVIAKLVIWLILGAFPMVLYRMPKQALVGWILIFILGGFATYFAAFKPMGNHGSADASYQLPLNGLPPPPPEHLVRPGSMPPPPPPPSNSGR